MDRDAKKLVESGYDYIAQQYLAWGQRTSPRIAYLHKLLAHLPETAQVLELGCGAGIPRTQLIAQQAHVTGVDISAAQIALAQQHVPAATLVQADMMTLEFPPATFDAIVAFYSIIHLPRDEQVVLFQRLARWLRPSGQLLVNLGIANDPGTIEPDWLGAPMYWSSFDAETNLNMVKQAGFMLIESELIADDEDGKPVLFLWIWARKSLEEHLA